MSHKKTNIVFCLTNIYQVRSTFKCNNKDNRRPFDNVAPVSIFKFKL